MKLYQIKIEVTLDQIQALVQFAEKQKDFHLTQGGEPEVKEWQYVRDTLAYHLDMLSGDIK